VENTSAIFRTGKAEYTSDFQARTSKLSEIVNFGDFYKPIISSNLFRCLNGGVSGELTCTFGVVIEFLHCLELGYLNHIHNCKNIATQPIG